jgi:hypothetical protein
MSHRFLDSAIEAKEPRPSVSFFVQMTLPKTLTFTLHLPPLKRAVFRFSVNVQFKIREQSIAKHYAFPVVNAYWEYSEHRTYERQHARMLIFLGI